LSYHKALLLCLWVAILLLSAKPANIKLVIANAATQLPVVLVTGTFGWRAARVNILTGGNLLKQLSRLSVNINALGIENSPANTPSCRQLGKSYLGEPIVWAV
jgi:hypothetical protein